MFVVEKQFKKNFFFRIKLCSDNEDEPQSAIDTFVTPSTPVGQAGIFGALEPPVTTETSDFTIPTSDYKWNQIVELQLSDGKKVFLKKKNEILQWIYL